jgi:hypothetical protein
MGAATGFGVAACNASGPERGRYRQSRTPLVKLLDMFSCISMESFHAEFPYDTLAIKGNGDILFIRWISRKSPFPFLRIEEFLAADLRGFTRIVPNSCRQGWHVDLSSSVQACGYAPDSGSR